MSPTASCPPLKHLAKFAKGTLSEEATEILTLHVNACDYCQETIETLREMEPQPTQKRRDASPSSRLSAGKALVFAGVLGLVSAVAYFGWNAFSERDPIAAQSTESAEPEPPSSIDPTVTATTETGPTDPEPVVTDGSANGFQFGGLPPETPIEKIRVSITTGEQGADLSEPVDLHLGFGFPLRLYPLGGSGPAGFSAVAQTSSLTNDVSRLSSGEEAWFEFDTQPDEPGNDVLRATPQLLSGLKIGDICKIGFASPGQSDWELAAYTIEINDQPFASNDSVHEGPEKVLARDEETLIDALPKREVLVNQLEEYKVLDVAGYLTDEEREDWESAKKEVESLDVPIQLAGGRLMGQYPWYVEPAPELAASQPQSTKPIDVTLVTSSQAQSGTLNTVYLLAGAKKFQLASSASPLRDGPELHRFRISAVDLEQDPIDESDLDQVGIGVIGGNHRFAEVPDRTRLDRVLVSVGDQPAYDSELDLDDSLTLSHLQLIPLAHLDDSGNVIENVMASDLERPAWRSGDRLADTPVESSVQQAVGPAEPEPPPGLPPSPFIGIASNPNPYVPSGPPPNVMAPNVTAPGGFAPNSSVPPPIYVVQLPMRGLNPPRQLNPRPSMGQRTPTAIDLLIPILAALLNQRQQAANFPSTPAVGNSGNAPLGGAPGVVPVAPSNTLQISDVEIDRNQAGRVRDGQQVVVHWRETNASEVAAYDVRLNLVLPHIQPSQRILLNNKRVPRRGRLESTWLPAIDLSNPALRLTPEERKHVFVQPEVIAIGNDGRPLANGLSAAGPLVPVHPKDWTFDRFRLITGPIPRIDPAGWIQAQDPLSVTPGFQLGGDGYGHWGSAANRWLPYGWGQAGWAVAERLRGLSQFATCGLEFGRYPTNVSMRNVGDHVSLRFDAYPISPTRDLRLTGLLGFIDGDAISPNTAEFQVRVIVQRIPRGGSPTALQEPSPGPLNANELLRIGTTTSVKLEKTKGNTPGAMQLIDIPVPILSRGQPALQNNGLPLQYDWSSTPITAGSELIVSLTIMASQDYYQGDEALALFGLRLIPD